MPNRAFVLASIATTLAVHFGGTVAAALADLQSPEQQACINSLNKAGAKVASTQGKENTTCVKRFAKETVVDAQACLTADTKMIVSKAESKTVAADASKCSIAPDFGRNSTAEINDSAVNEELALVSDLFGGDLNTALVTATNDAAAAACQAAAIKAWEKLAAAKRKVFLKCKKAGLKDGSIDSAATLELCLDTTETDAKVAKTAAKLVGVVADKCASTSVSAAFPGECAAAPVFTDCVAVAVDCRLCRTINAMDDVSRDCDSHDDDQLNGSCGSPSTTTTTTSSTTTTSTAEAICGDGTTTPPEQCDDNNADACGSCNATCTATQLASATGQITIVSAPPDGATFTLNDGISTAVVFEFEFTGGVAPGHTAIFLSPGDTASVVAAKISNASNNHPTLGIDAFAASDTVSLTNQRQTSLGNHPITQVGTGFTVFGMSGGQGGNCTAGVECSTNDDCASGSCPAGPSVCD
ncbi:MAG: hypothetical protein ABR587_12650 [Candidatus Binatia bacterium]